MGLLGAVLGRSWGHLGAFLAPSCETQGPRNLDFTLFFVAFAPYRRSCSDLLLIFGELDLSFAIWGHLGAVMGPSLAILGRLGAHLWAMLGRFGAILGHLWAVLGPSWGRSGPSWCHLGAIFRYSWALLGHLRPSRGHETECGRSLRAAKLNPAALRHRSVRGRHKSQGQ